MGNFKAIIFDCFGVLVGEGWKSFRDEHFGKTGKEHEWADEQMQEVSRGRMTHEAIVMLMHEKTGVLPEDFLQVLHTNPVNVALLEYIEELRAHYKIGFLSNVGVNRLPELFTKHQISLFDDMVLSYELGVSKPDPLAYTHTADRLGVDTKECVFVDDTKSYCEGAERVGMKPIHYTNFEMFKKELEEVL